MKAMILAAGRGERMRPLTDKTPKPLLQVAGKALIEYHLEQLSTLGVTEVVINHAWLGEQIPVALGDGSRYGLKIHYSDESNGALETAGGIIKALPLLCGDASESGRDNAPFLVINGDVFISPHLSQIPSLAENKLAHLWLVENPEHNLSGDFSLLDNQVNNISSQAANVTYTFSGIALYRPEFFLGQQAQAKLPLAPMLRQAIENQVISGEVLTSQWTDVGTPQRLEHLNQQYTNKKGH